MNDQEAREFAIGLMQTAPAVYLATIDAERFPQIRALLKLFAPERGDLVVYFTTNTSSEKVRQVEADPKAAAYFCHPEKFHGLMLRGVLDIISDQRLKHEIWRDGWEEFYPQGPDDPDYTMLRLAPTLAKGWHGEGCFQFRVC